MRHLPNILTLCRLALAPVIAWLIVQHEFRQSLSVVLLAGLTDWFDGYTARRLNVASNLGVIFDPLADKTLLVTLFVSLAYAGLIPRWLLSLVIGRDIVIVAGSLLLRIFRNIRRFLPSMSGKVSTFFQIVLVLLTLLCASFQLGPLLWLKSAAIVLTTIFTVWSGIEYVRLGIRLTRRAV